MRNIKTRNTQKGFTLIETLIAIFILTLSITGPIYISSLSFRNTVDNRDSISVQYLAEEVIEVIKNKKDKKSLEGIPDTSNLKTVIESIIDGPYCFEPNRCMMMKDASGDYVFESCFDNKCSQMYFDPDSDIAVYGSELGSVTSKFTREFYFEESVNNDDELTLTVNITWRNKGLSKVYTLKETFYNLDYRDFYID